MTPDEIRLAAILAAQAPMRASLLEIEALPEPTDEDATRADGLISEWDVLETERVPLAAKITARSAAIEAVRNAAPGVENGFSGGAPEVIVKRNVFENLDGISRGFMPGADMRAAALTAIEEAADEAQDSAREQATQLVQRDGRAGGIARHILLTGSPAYRSGFQKYLEHPETFGSMLERDEAEAMRAAMSTAGANGGYLIPFLLDPTIILTNAGSANPFRQISRVETGTSNQWHGITSAGVNAEWKAEGAAAADATPTFTQPAITAFLADAYVLGSYEALEDTNIATQIPMLVADAKDRLEAAAFATGSGTGQPWGVVAAVAAVAGSKVISSTPGAFTTGNRADVDGLLVAVPPRYRKTSSWIANYAIFDVIRRMDIYGGGSFWANLGGNLPEVLLGRSIYEASAMDSTQVAGKNVLLAGDFSQYLIYDRIGVSLEFVPNVFDPTTGRPTGQRGWFATWRVGANITDPTAFRVLQL
jgi:HK97 family phage major capsid protein